MLFEQRRYQEADTEQCKLKIENDSLKRENQAKTKLLIVEENKAIEPKRAFTVKKYQSCNALKRQEHSIKKVCRFKEKGRSLKGKRDHQVEKENIPPSRWGRECQMNITGVDRDLIEVSHQTKSKFVDVGRRINAAIAMPSWQQ